MYDIKSQCSQQWRCGAFHPGVLLVYVFCWPCCVYWSLLSCRIRHTLYLDTVCTITGINPLLKYTNLPQFSKYHFALSWLSQATKTADEKNVQFHSSKKGRSSAPRTFLTNAAINSKASEKHPLQTFKTWLVCISSEFLKHPPSTAASR